MLWRNDAPPKDGTPFIADVGWPEVVVAAWCAADNNFTFANLCTYDAEVAAAMSGPNEAWFETEHTDTVQQWMHLPTAASEQPSNKRP